MALRIAGKYVRNAIAASGGKQQFAAKIKDNKKEVFEMLMKYREMIDQAKLDDVFDNYHHVWYLYKKDGKTTGKEKDGLSFYDLWNYTGASTEQWELQRPLGKQQMARLAAVFNSLDLDGDQQLDFDEFSALARKVAGNQTEMNIELEFQIADLNNNGQIDFHEFVCYFFPGYVGFGEPTGDSGVGSGEATDEKAAAAGLGGLGEPTDEGDLSLLGESAFINTSHHPCPLITTVPAPPKDLTAWEPIDMIGKDHGLMLTTQPNASECQKRCANLTRCRHWSYWELGKHCHVEGIAAIRTPARLGFVSGSMPCKEMYSKMPDNGERFGVGNDTWLPKLLDVKCLEIGAMHMPFFKLHQIKVDKEIPEEFVEIIAVRKCKNLCRDTSGCEYFNINFPGKTCSLARASAYRLHPIFAMISGSANCWAAPPTPKPLPSAMDEVAVATDAFVHVREPAGRWSLAAFLTTGAVALALFSFWAGIFVGRRSRIAQHRVPSTSSEASDSSVRRMALVHRPQPALSCEVTEDTLLDAGDEAL